MVAMCPTLSKVEVCSYLKDGSDVIDYELEVDLLASELGEVYSLSRVVDRGLVGQLCEVVYKLISMVRDNRKPSNVDISSLENMYHLSKPSDIEGLVLPVSDSVVACKWHVVRSQANKIIRWLYKNRISEDQFNDIIDCFNFISQIAFNQAVTCARREGDIQPFKG